MRLKLGRLLAFGLILCLLFACAPALSESMHREVENPSLSAEVQLGYDGRVTYGKAIPIRVTVRNGGGDLEGILAVNTYVNRVKYDRYETEIFVPAGGERTVVLPVLIESQQDLFTVEILRDGETLLAVNALPAGIINPSAMMIGLLSTRPRNLANLEIDQESDVLYRYEYWETVALTPETLPDDGKLLDSFGMIVLDDVDPAGLTEKQQKALKDWIARGHVLLCGGGRTAPQNLAFLGDLTALRAEDFTVSGSVIVSLESFLGQQTTDEHPTTALARITGGDALASDEDGNGLLWRETVGSGRIYTLAWEAGDAALNASPMMHPFFQQLLILRDAALYRNVLYAEGSAGARYFPGEDTRLEIRNPMPTAAIVIAVCVLAAAAVWFLLRKLGKTVWMWAALPALALAAALSAVLLSGSSSMNSPVASTAVNIVQDGSGRTARFTGVTAAAPRAGIRSYSMEGEELSAVLYEGYYGPDDDEDGASREPAVLRAVYRRGTRGETAVSAATPWETVHLEARRAEAEDGRVEAEIWKEKDGFHGVVTNLLPYGLKEGTVTCGYGYVKIPALAPGESADFVLLTETAKDPSDPEYENGKIYMNSSSSIYGVTAQLYDIGNPDETGSRASAMIGMTSAASDYVADPEGSSGGQNTVVFLYSAEPAEPIAANVLVDGKETEGRSEIALYNAAIRYLTIGKTGVVYRAPGMDVAVRCNLDAKGLPAGDQEEDASSKYFYYDLSELPTFRFHPEDLADVEISELTLGMDAWYLSQLKCYVLDVKDQTWTEVQANAPIEDPEKYLDAEGNLYCQFRPVAADTYMSIPRPTLTVEGTLKK